VRQADGIDAPANDHGDGLDRRLIVRQQAAAAGHVADVDRETRRLVDRDTDDGGNASGTAVDIAFARGARHLAPADDTGAQRRGQLSTDVVEHRGDVLLAKDSFTDPLAKVGVIRPIEQDVVHEPRDRAADCGVEQGRRDPQRHQHADIARIAQRHLR
jgi:hypothetical protein